MTYYLKPDLLGAIADSLDKVGGVEGIIIQIDVSIWEGVTSYIQESF